MPSNLFVAADPLPNPTTAPGRLVWRAAIATAFAVLLAACGGGDPDEPARVQATLAGTTSAAEPSDDDHARVGVAQVLSDLTDDAQRTQVADLAATNGTRERAQAIPGQSTIPTLLPPLLDWYCRIRWQWDAHCGATTQEQVSTRNGQTRNYVLWKPRTTALRAKVPLVVVLHGTNGTGPEFFDFSGWREKGFRDGLIVAFPSALRHCYRQDHDHDGTHEATHVFYKWADGQLGASERPLCSRLETEYLKRTQYPDLARELADDVGFFRRMVAQIKLRHPEVDLKRVYVAGFSNGAAMAGRLAAEASFEIAAVSTHASVVPTQIVRATANQNIRPLSLLHSIGSEDEEQKAQMGYPNGPIPLSESVVSDHGGYYNGVVLPFTTILRLSSQAYTYDAPPITGYVNGPNVSVASAQFTFSGSLRGARNTFRTIVIDGATHEYPNGRGHPVILAEHVWAFFAPHRLP